MANYEIAHGYDYVEVTPTPAVSSSGNFQSDITFEIPQPDMALIVPKNSYLSATIQITMVREDGTTITCLEPIINSGTRLIPTHISVPYLASNPLMCLFQNIKCYFDNQELINYQNASTLNTLYRVLYESKAEQLTNVGTNAINLMSQDDIDTTGGVISSDVEKLKTK